VSESCVEDLLKLLWIRWRGGGVFRLGNWTRASKAFLPSFVLVVPFHIAAEGVPGAAFGLLLVEVRGYDTARNREKPWTLITIQADEHIDVAVTP